MDDSTPAFASLLQRYRQAAGLTQEEQADLARVRRALAGVRLL